MFDTAVPVLFNLCKHHLGYIRYRINDITTNDYPKFNSVQKELLIIGDSVMDLYTGSLLPSDISNEITGILKKQNAFNRRAYINWINESSRNYRLLKLSDGSVWTLRTGNDEEKFVHIHPGRQSVHTVRVRAVTLKTSVIVLAYLRLNDLYLYDLELVNKLRKNFLSLPPLKVLNAGAGLNKLIGIIRSADANNSHSLTKKFT